jgi:hypothetical protein
MLSARAARTGPWPPANTVAMHVERETQSFAELTRPRQQADAGGHAPNWSAGSIVAGPIRRTSQRLQPGTIQDQPVAVHIQKPSCTGGGTRWATYVTANHSGGVSYALTQGEILVRSA